MCVLDWVTAVFINVIAI